MSQHEFEIIERYFKVISYSSEGVVLGPGDDCAVLSFQPGEEVCASTDTLLAGVHFPEDCEADLIASRLVGANLSDLAAMGAKPHSCLIAMTMPEVSSNWLEQFSGCLNDLLSEHGMALVGGNLARGSLSLSMTVLGTVPTGAAITRSGAEVNEDIYVTGTLGDAGQGLVDLVSAKDSTGYLTQRYSVPSPRLDIGQRLRGIASAMIDISDGFLADLGHLCEASEVGARVEFDCLPISEELCRSLGEQNARLLALNAGDDYELCFTASPTYAEEIQEIGNDCQVKITQVGRVTQSSTIDLVDASGNVIDVSNTGYKHF